MGIVIGGGLFAEEGGGDPESEVDPTPEGGGDPASEGGGDPVSEGGGDPPFEGGGDPPSEGGITPTTSAYAAMLPGAFCIKGNGGAMEQIRININRKHKIRFADLLAFLEFCINISKYSFFKT